MDRRAHRRGPFFGHGRGPAEKPKDFKKAARKLISYMKPHLFWIILVVTLAVISTVISIQLPKIMGKAVTKVFNGFMAKMATKSLAKLFGGKAPNRSTMDYKGIARILTKVGILAVISAVLGYIQQYIMAGVTQKVVYRMRRDLREKMSRLPLKFYDSHSYGDVMSRVSNDVDVISNVLQQGLVQTITSVVSIIGIIVMMITISPSLTLFTLITLALSAVLVSFFVKKSQVYFSNRQKYIGKLSARAEEAYGGHIVLKAYGKEEEEMKKFEEINEKLAMANLKSQFISGVIRPLIFFIGNLGYVIVSVLGGVMVVKKTIEIGDITAFIQYVRRFNQPIIQMASMVNLIQSALAASERIFEVLEEEEESPDPENPVVLEKAEGHVVFDKVYFSYVPEKPLFENLSFEVKPGYVAAIVGPTGAGKTTIVNLLMRFYDIQSGKITIDGVDIKMMRRSDLRKLFGMVLQDTWLFHGTIRENIAFGREGATEEEIIEAAKRAYAHNFIMALPEGYDTVIDEGMSNLSQGERQLITIARAFLADPDILILDEATSNVDTLTEAYIQMALRDIMKGRTNFVIAHRLSTIKNADVIFVMNEGKIIEIGTHEELLEKGGFYSQLYKSQFLGALVED